MRNRSILFVDDDPGIRKALERTLHNEPYQRLYAGSAAEAKKIINENRVHIIVSDLLMPEVDGITLLKWVKTVKPEIVRMVLSMKDDSETILDAINKGNIYHYIQKPWNNSELKILIQKGIDWYNIQEERDQLVKNLEIQNQTLEQRVKERTNQLLAITSEAEIGKHTSQIVHNLNNILNNFFSSLGLLEMALTEKEIELSELRLYHGYLVKGAESLKMLVSEILIRAREKENFKAIGIDLNMLVRDEIIFWDMNPEFKYKITKRLILDENIPGIIGNPIQIKQIFDNVIKNAIDAMEKSEQKSLTIETGTKDEFIVLKFTDSGEGISEENITKIFLPGFTTKPVGKGTGLGLASTKAMIDAYSGTIDVQSEKNKGTTFTICIPVKPRSELES
jgi:two-component system, sensor histidine kinase and response regulator